MGRRGENIRKRADGRWEARVVKGRPTAGKTNYKYFYGKTYQEVRQKKKEFLARCPAPSEVAFFLPISGSVGEVLLRDVADKWLVSKETVVKESTYACYGFMVRRHILPALGELPLGKINSDILVRFLEKEKSDGRLTGGSLSNKTISDMKVVLMQILRFAKKKELIPAVPECPAVTSRQADISVFTKREQDKVEAQAMKEDTPFSLGVLISLYGGIRIGEACGLQWGDFDFQNGTISINKTVYRITVADKQSSAKTKVVIGTPKTDCSVRTIPLPAQAFRYLAERQCSKDCYVLTGTTKYMEPRVCLDRYKRLLRRAGVADHTFHTLRHTFATRCVENGVDVKSLSEIMGHSDVKITLQRYVHPSMETKKAQVNKLPFLITDGRISGQEKGRIA